MKGASKGHIAILTTNIIFGINIVIAKNVLSNGNIDALALTYFRILGATIAFWIASLFVKREKLIVKDFVILFFASLFGIVINQTSFIVGLKTTSPIESFAVP